PEIERETLRKTFLEFCARTRMKFVPANLIYLHAGGRCSNLELLGSRILKLHPCIEILDGKLVATVKYRGSFRKVVKKAIEDCAEKNHLRRERIWLIETPRFSEELKQAAENTAKELGFQKIFWVKTGCVITTHGGPGAFGVVGIA
ncbi:MAG: DegV family protein, partial [Clostridiales bacterium]|nr:DegV family protein [Clostridiales bacterium]